MCMKRFDHSYDILRNHASLYFAFPLTQASRKKKKKTLLLSRAAGGRNLSHLRDVFEKKSEGILTIPSEYPFSQRGENCVQDKTNKQGHTSNFKLFLSMYSHKVHLRLGHPPLTNVRVYLIGRWVVRLTLTGTP